MKRLLRRIYCVWFVGHDWFYYYIHRDGSMTQTKQFHLFTGGMARGDYFSHMLCDRCGDRVG